MFNFEGITTHQGKGPSGAAAQINAVTEVTLTWMLDLGNKSNPKPSFHLLSKSAK
jgi:hypothetical protein